MISSKWKWSERFFDPIFRFCIALSNLHIRAHPLRVNDGSRYNEIRNRMEAIANERVEKRRRAQKRYRGRRRRRTDITYRDIGGIKGNPAPYQDECD